MWLVLGVSKSIDSMYKGSTQLNSAPDDYFWLFTLHDPEAGLGVDMP
jgi:hypothetical protein